MILPRPAFLRQLVDCEKNRKMVPSFRARLFPPRLKALTRLFDHSPPLKKETTRVYIGLILASSEYVYV